MELKEQIKNHLTDQKEQERLEKVKANSKLKKVILYTNGSPQCDNVKKQLDSEGIKYTEKTQEKHQELVSQVVAITNINNFPIALVNENYLAPGRDYQQPQQLVFGIQHFGAPNFKNPTFEEKIIEHSKTNNYNLWTKVDMLDKKISPLINFITNLQKEIAEEEKGE